MAASLLLSALLASPADRLHDAVRADDAAAVALALKDPLAKATALESRDALGYTPLLRAADHANLPVLKLLLEAGADLAAQDNSGSSVLHLAAESGSADALTLLLGAGAAQRPLAQQVDHRREQIRERNRQHERHQHRAQVEQRRADDAEGADGER